MKENQSFALQTFLVALLCNAVLLVVIYLIGGAALQGQAPAVFGVGAVLTLALWGGIQVVGRRLATGAPVAVPAPPAQPARVTPPAPPSEASAIQILAILQRKGRLIDFLQEDLSAFDDAQIGAAVRTIHEGCQQALAEYVTLEPVYQEAEGSQITVPPGFDAHAVRLTGNIVGDPPFKGALRHRGWRVVRLDLPRQVAGSGKERILAAAEVEVGG